MSRLLKSSGSVGAATLISRLLGFAREAAYAGFMGVGPVADAFYFANTVPNLMRRLLGEGALTAAIIPIFKDRERHQGDAVMWRSVNAVLSALILLLGAFVALGMLTLTGLIVLAPLTLDQQLIARLMLVMFPYVAFVLSLIHI